MTAEEMRKHNLEVLRKQGLTPGPTTQQTPYQQALAAYQPQRYTFWNGGRVNDGFKIDNSNAGTWNQIQQLYNAGDRAGATALVNELSGKGLFSGYYDDNGNYNGFVQGYTGSANASFQPVVGGRLISSGDTDTGIWLTPDGKALKGTTGGMLTDNGDTWSRFQPNQGSNWTWKDVREQNGLDWGDTYAIRAAHGDFTNPALNTPEGNARKLSTLYEKPLGFTDEEWAKHTSTYDPNYIAETAAAAGGNGQYPSGGTPAGQTPYQQALDAYQPMSYEEWRAQNGGGSTPSAQPMTAPGAYDPNSDPLWQQYLAQYGNAQAPEYAGDPYQAQRDAALAAYGEKWQGSEYQPLRDEALQRAASMEWNYDPNTDPVWQALQKQYRREGQRATEDTLGRYAAMTGGMPSTAAVSAAQQAGNRYAAELSDRLPQVYQDAYNRYLQEYQRQLGISDAYAGFDDREYQRWLQSQGQNLDLADRYNQYGQQDYNRFQDTLDQWNRDRSFGYGAARDNQQLGRQQVEDQYGRYRDAVGDARYADETAYNRYRDTVADQRWDAQWAQQLREYADAQNWKATEWEQYLREYGDKLSQQEREWAYQQMRDSISDARYADAQQYERAQDEQARQRQAALDEQNAAESAYARLVNGAKLAAQYGDYSGLAALGISPNEEDLRRMAIAGAGRTTPVGSGGTRSGGSSGVGGETEDYATSTVNAAYRAYLNGDRSDLTLRILNSAGLPVSGRDPEGDPEGGEMQGEYAVLDRVLADMQAQGRPWNQLQVELDGEFRDGRITREEYEALRQKYVSRGLEDGVRNLEGVVHRDGSPMSAGFSGIWRTVRDLADRQEKNKALAAMRQAYEAGTIHEYEIDVMMDQLGW